MTEQEGKILKNKKSLLMKYEIPLDHLSDKYVEKCNDRKELERIVKILRSGEEGYYPQLIECAESRLKQIAPESHLLWTEDPVLTKSTLGDKNWNEIAEDMADWTQEMKNRDEALQGCCAPGPDLPAVRQVENNKLASTEAGPSRAKNAAPRDYSEWDKFDADKEILKMELEDERKREQTAKNKRQQEKEKKKSKNEVENSTLKAASNLSSVEKEYMATQEKDRGNEYYRSGDYEQAVKSYSNSIVLCPTPTAYNNRAMAQLKLQKYEEVIADCNQVLKVESQNVKALHRRGIAHQGNNCYEQAYEDFSKVMEFEPENQAAKSLADQMKRKLEPAVKSVRLSIEDECCQPHGFVFPSPKPNIAVNEWGLAKVMCRCNGTPSWVHRKPPKCKICQRKRAERRAKQEEEARKVAEISEINNSENPEIDQMLTDEKGSGDMRTTEKIVELDTGFVSTMQAELDDSCVRVEEHEMNDKIDFTVESMPTKDEKDTSYTCNVINKENSKSEREAYMDNSKNNESIVHSKITSTEANKSKTELSCNTKVLTNEDSRKSPKEVKQKSLAENDVLSGKQMKVKIANKYKKNVNTERETAPEQQVCDVSSVGTITSPFEFVKVWESLKVTSDLSSHAQVLHSVKPSDLASVIGNKLDGPMLSTILMCLEKNFAPELVLEYLNNIVQLPRFNIVIMFLQPPEKQAVCRLLEKLEKSDVRPTAALWEAFAC